MKNKASIQEYKKNIETLLNELNRINSSKDKMWYDHTNNNQEKMWYNS